MSASPAVRSLRAAVFAAVCVLLAVGGHRLGTGVTPSVWAEAAGFSGVFGAGWVLGGRERSLGGIGAVMLGTQAVLHVLFEEVGSSSSAVAGHHAMGSGAPVLVGAVEHVREMGTPVTAGHLLAALVASWWLRRGEAAVWGVLRGAAQAVASPRGGRRLLVAPVALPEGAGGVPRTVVRLVALPRTLLRHALRRRGPPRWVPYVI